MSVKCQNGEQGAIMLEGMIVVLITMFVLIWILALGFLHYQRYLVTIVTNDACDKVAATYTNPSVDMITGFVEPSGMHQREPFKIGNPSLKTINQDRADSYIKYVLDHTNFIGVMKQIDVRTSLVKDSALRSHLEVTSECTFRTPLGFALEWAGMEPTVTYSCTARAEATDLMDYIYTTDFVANYTSGNWLGGKVIKNVNKFITIFGSHNYAKS